jgi:hypothetical protein
MIRVEVRRGSAWRCVYRADDWTVAACITVALVLATVGIGFWRAAC